MRSIVLVPIDPVAPRIVIERMAGADWRSDRDSGTALVIASPRSSTSPHQKTARRRREAAAQDADHRGRYGGRQEAIEPVHDPAVSRIDLPGVFAPNPGFDRGFERVAARRHGGEWRGAAHDRERFGKRDI